MPILTDDLWGAAGKGDNERILFHLDQGADVNARGQAGINGSGLRCIRGTRRSGQNSLATRSGS